jgi:UDP-glucose 4-epimerase
MRETDVATKLSGTILVTGAHGFIGRHVCRDLANHGARVCGVGHGNWPPADAERSGLTAWVNGEVTAANLDAIAAAHGPLAAVVHLAGGATVGASLSAPLEDFSRTCATTARLLDWIRQRSARTAVLAVSSAAVYGAGHQGAIAEGAATNPYSPYGTHKLVMEMLCRCHARDFGIAMLIVRLFSVYGEGLRKQLLWDLCSALESRGSANLAGTGQEIRDWIHVADAARLIRCTLPLASTEAPAVNGGTGQGTPVATIARELASAWGGNPLITFSGVGRAGDPHSLVADIRAAGAAGFEPQVPLRSGLQRYVEWFRSRRHTE